VTVVRRAPGAVAHEIGGQVVLVSLPGLETQVLNDVGSRIWALADGRSEEAIAQQLALEFDVAATVAQHDVQVFVDALVQEGWLERCVEAVHEG
jgi:hypothetical protein